MNDSETIRILSSIENRLGQLAKGQENLLDYVGSVSRDSKKTDEKLQEHMSDIKTAHGAEATTGFISKVAVWVGIVGNFGGLLYIVFKLGKAFPHLQ